jgi:hypothetical protein
MVLRVKFEMLEFMTLLMYASLFPSFRAKAV